MTIEGERPDAERDGEPASERGREPAPETPEPAPDTPEPAPDTPDPAAAAGDESERPERPADEAEAPAPEAERPPPRPRRRDQASGGGDQPEVVPGADLEPDLVLEEPARQEHDEYDDATYAERYGEPEGEEEPSPVGDERPPTEAQPAPRTPMQLAADARYRATGKRKTAVARVILRPGSGTYTVNGRSLEHFFPRFGLQATARQPLEAAGYETRMDVVARLHGGGVAAQAGALRHGVARALVEADPNLREDLKRRGYLTRDPRAKERKKAGLKKARKRPQFSKR